MPRIPDRRLRQGEVENSEFSEIPETSENIFRGFPLRVFHFAPAYTPKRKARSWKNSEFDQNALKPVYIDQKTSIKVSNYLEHVPVTQFNQLQGETP